MTVLVGRDAELERIDAAIRRRDALPAGILLHGVAGIGKTSLWEEAVRRASAAGFRILSCALTRHESRLAFAGLADLIGPSLAEVLPALAAPQARALEQALAVGGSEDAVAEAAVADERAVAFAFQGALSWLARRRPIAVAVDDIQWLDPSSAVMLSYAIRRLRAEPLLLLFAQRDGEAAEHQVQITEGTGIELERIAVGPLPMGALHRLIRTRLGSSLTRPQLLHVAAASAGNPLHALELARSIGPGGAALDDGLASLLADRVAALPVATRHALALAAIAADTDREALSTAYGPTYFADLGPAIEADLVRVDDEHVRFAHPLMAVAAEAGVSDRQRTELHRRLAANATSAEARAAHLAQAGEMPDREVADALEAAARLSRRRGARAGSAELFESAARMTPPTDSVARDRRRLAAAEAWWEAGDGQHADSILTSLLAYLPAGDQRCEAAWRLGILRDEAGDWKPAVELWRGALAGTSEPSLRARILGSLAITEIYTGSGAEAVKLAAAAVTAAEETRDPVHLARALAVQAMALAMSGGRGYQAIIDRALVLESGIDESLGEWSPTAIAAEVARHVGDVEAARRYYPIVLERAVATGDANQEQWAAFGLASTLMLSGEYARASDLADMVLDMADQTGQMRIAAKSLRAQADAYLGELDVARRGVSEAIEAARAADEATHLFGALVVLGLVETFAGREAAAAMAYGEAHQIAVAGGHAHATAIRMFIGEAEESALARRLEQAEAALAALDETVAGDPPAWAMPSLQRARAAIRAARGDLRGARDDLARVLESANVTSFDRARTELAMGLCSRRLREHGRARDELGRALAGFTALGAPSWRVRAESELARVPGRRSARTDALTQAEAAIAELVASGRSNKEVATALFLSVKTVEAALTRVYEKVGVRSRAELAHTYAAAKH